jgi:hypothetical protein
VHVLVDHQRSVEWTRCYYEVSNAHGMHPVEPVPIGPTTFCNRNSRQGSAAFLPCHQLDPSDDQQIRFFFRKK